MNDKVCGGTIECFNYRYRRNIGMPDDGFYMNGGIILMNIDSVRKFTYEDKFTAYIKTYGDSLSYLDQDVINSMVPESKKEKTANQI